jgi:hypothetical protein
MKRAPKQQNTAAGQPAVTSNSRRLTEKQRAMVEMRKTASVRETAKRFNVPQSQVTWAECIFHWNEEGGDACRRP